MSVYDYMVEVLVSDDHSSVGLAGASIFLFASLMGKLLLCFGSNFALLFLCADGGMSLVCCIEWAATEGGKASNRKTLRASLGTLVMKGIRVD
jgi:hypothetical protein